MSRKTKTRTPNLREAMADAGVTISDMIQATGKKQSTIYSWTRGRTKPTHGAFAQVVHLLGISASRLTEILEETRRQSGLD